MLIFLDWSSGVPNTRITDVDDPRRKELSKVK